MPKPTTVSLITALLALAAAVPAPCAARDRERTPPPAPVGCVELATDPANGLLENPVVKAVNSLVVPASGPNVAYCQVNVLYGTTPEQNINIRVGLPLNALDRGTGGVQ